MLSDEITARCIEIRRWAKEKGLTASSVGATDEEPVGIRPQEIADLVGQEDVRRKLEVAMAGAMLRGTKPAHTLISGPPGFGKTSLAGVVANELQGRLVTLSGPLLRRPQDLLGVLLKMEPNTVLFIDECHAMSRAAAETLYTALEDGAVSVMLGSGTDTTAATQQLGSWTCVCATTRPGQLTEPFKARFGLQLVMDPYTVEELTTIAENYLVKSGVGFLDEEARTIGARCKGVPRVALQLCERVLDFAACSGDTTLLAQGRAAEALQAFDIDQHGLDNVDRRILSALVNDCPGRPVGVEALSQMVGLDRSEVESREADLVRLRWVARTPRGRVALPKAYAYIRDGQAPAPGLHAGNLQEKGEQDA
jgi:holliday junction DNA helicase RuvB